MNDIVIKGVEWSEVSSNFVAYGYSNLEKEIRKRITRKYELDLRMLNSLRD